MLTAATVAMSAPSTILAFAAAPDYSPSTGTSVVCPRCRLTSAEDDGPRRWMPRTSLDDSVGRVGGGHGADDVNDAPDDTDGQIGGGRGADDVNDAPDRLRRPQGYSGTGTTRPETPDPARHSGSDAGRTLDSAIQARTAPERSDDSAGLRRLAGHGSDD